MSRQSGSRHLKVPPGPPGVTVNLIRGRPAIRRASWTGGVENAAQFGGPQRAEDALSGQRVIEAGGVANQEHAAGTRRRANSAGSSDSIQERAAASDMGLLTCPYVFTPQDAERMAAAGADVLIPHMGLTTGGAIGAETARTLDECVELVDQPRQTPAPVSLVDGCRRVDAIGPTEEILERENRVARSGHEQRADERVADCGGERGRRTSVAALASVDPAMYGWQSNNPITIACGHFRNATDITCAEWQPNSRASYDAAATTPRLPG